MAISLLFVAAAHAPWGFDKTHAFCSTVAIVAAALAIGAALVDAF